MMLWVTLSTLPILLVVVWLYTVATVKGRFPTLKNRRICLLIAHPDDEAMFFAPALLALTDPALGNHLKILCLSSGKYCQCRDWVKVANQAARRCRWAGRNTKEGAGQERHAARPTK